MVTTSKHLHIGFLIYPQLDQLDFTGPFEVLSRLPHATCHVAWKETKPLRDWHGLVLTPEKTLGEVPPLDVLVVPGGPGQEALMEDEDVLSFLRVQAEHASWIFSVCTGSLICGAAGLLRGVRATSHWSALDLLRYFGALPTQQRVVVDGKVVSAAGVTSGIDGALRLAALLRGDTVAQEIQLAMEYAPAPPFESGTLDSAPPEIRQRAEQRITELASKRQATAKRIAARWQS